ncbi:lytic transglycosylase domain-containing protein [Oligoflexus tunisiensis]|uniref:lytic transglycosylase domain-containing protein n=1 Tax=Oligoflexus tunisiensis TaxID=708132 RepID=UPI00114CB1EE|nr:lytic transglycosylase domain-containing protein [Oligoflexus tunisiensis]
MNWIKRSLLCVSLLTGCAGVTHEPLVTIDAAGFKPTPSPIKEQYRRLRALVQDREGAQEAVQDILVAMEAVQSEEAKDWETAAKQWLFVLENDSGAMAAMAFPRWVKAQERLVAEPVQAEILARLLLAQTNEGQEAPWLKKQGYTDIASLTQKIKDLQGDTTAQGTASLPASPRDIKDDPFLEKAAKASCRLDLPAAWRNWLRTQGPNLKLYWEGLQASCRMEYEAAISKFEQALPGLRLNIKTWPYAVNAAERIVKARKSLGQREATTIAYQQLANLLDQPETQKAELGWSPFELWTKRIDTWFWVARNEALEGDYQNAKLAVHEGLNLINQAQTQIVDLNSNQSEELSNLRAEAYNILASRIAYEEGDLTAALSLTRMGQDIPGISKEWRQRLDWSEAWFSYMMKDRIRAVRVWKNLLTQIDDEQHRTRYYYWIGRALYENGQRGEAEDYFEKLQTDHPLSFYTVVGLPRIDPDYGTGEFFGSVSRLQSKLSSMDNIPWEAYRADHEAERRVARLELMLAANVNTWLDPIATELFRYVNSREPLMKDTEATLYVSRLIYMAGNYLQAIALTTSLSNQEADFWDQYPEQVLVYFPQPYQDIYQRTATQSYIDQEIALAISRQESSFEADVISPAEAIGLMQLMSNTAQRQASRLGLRLGEPQVDLKRPELNIALGTAYLAELGRRYRGHWHQAFAAYNAGEFVVDAWLQRRRAEDPLVWIEALSFAETSGYTKNVWRNWEVYRWLRGLPAAKPLL